MTTPLDHARSYMRLVSSQLAVPKFAAIDPLSFEQVRSELALQNYEAARRAAIAASRRLRFAIVASDGVPSSDPCSMIDEKRGFGRRQREEIERGY